jgi:hypothetical protein
MVTTLLLCVTTSRVWLFHGYKPQSYHVEWPLGLVRDDNSCIVAGMRYNYQSYHVE